MKQRPVEATEPPKSPKAEARAIVEAAELQCPNEKGQLEAERQKLTDLFGQSAAAEKKRLELLRMMHAAARPDPAELDAAVYIRTGQIPAQASTTTINPELEQVDRTIRVVAAAIDLQKAHVRRAEDALARAMGDALRPTHERIVAMADMYMRQLSDALAQEDGIRDALRERGLGVYNIRPLPLDAVRLDLEYSAAWLWQQDARENGYRI